MTEIAHGMLQILEFQMLFKDWHLMNSKDSFRKEFQGFWNFQIRTPQVLAIKQTLRKFLGPFYLCYSNLFPESFLKGKELEHVCLSWTWEQKIWHIILFKYIMISKCPRKGSTQISIHTSGPLSQWPLSSAWFFIHPGARLRLIPARPNNWGTPHKMFMFSFLKSFPREKCPYRNFFPEELPLKGSIMNF